MLDNDEFILDPYPRELTQNPLKKIWMPFKNGHISQRRGKMPPAGKQRGRQAMSLIIRAVDPEPHLLLRI